MRYIISCILSFLFIAQSSEARQWVVGNNESIQTIEKGLELAEDGDTVLIKKGIYYERSLVVDKEISILGESHPIIDAQYQGEIMTVTVANVLVQGIHFRNVATSYINDHAALRIQKTNHFQIRDNLFDDTFFAIYIEHSNKGTISNNRIKGNALEEMSSGNAIHLWYCKEIEVSDNHISGHRDGIYLEFVDFSTIKGNISEDNLRYGLHFMFSNNDVYENNVFRRNGAGVAVMFSKKINMFSNEFEYNWGKASYGLLLKEIYDAEIVHNNFTENTIAIYVEGSTRVNYLKNEFLRNGWAIKISGGCLDNIVSQNNFIQNSFDLALSSKVNNNTFHGNFWSDYSAYDLDRDGIGDIPYRPVKLFNYIVSETPESMVLLRSLFIDLINFSEKVSPVFTPENVIDERPLMNKIQLTER